jgi:putative ABC transport system permease protein
VTFPHDLRDALRTMVRAPAFALMTIVTLALGIAASTAMFSLVDGVLLRRLPFEKPERIVWLWHVWSGGDTGVFSISDFVEYRDRNRTLRHVSAFRQWTANLTGLGEPERLAGIRVSENFFELLGVQPTVGRRFVDAELRGKAARVVMISDGLWRRRFGGERGVVGQRLLLNGEPHEVLGVLPPEFVFPLPDAEIAVPISIETDPSRDQPQLNALRLVARLEDGVTFEQARTDLDTVTAYLRQLHPRANGAKYGVRLVPIKDEIVGPYRPMLLLLFGAVNAVLAIACVNLAGLFLTQAMTRRREYAMRAALGAGRWQLVRRALMESTVLALAGGALGVWLSRAAITALVALVPSSIPRVADVGVDRTVLLFALTVSIVTGVLFGLLPALQVSRDATSGTLRGDGRGATGAAAQRTRSRLLAAETALALVLLIGAGLFLRSFARLQAVSLGFDTHQVLSARLSLPVAYRNRVALTRFYDEFAARSAALPGVRSVSAASLLPLSGSSWSTDFVVEGRAAPKAADLPIAHYRPIGPRYFETLQIPIVQGREFTDQDRAGTMAVAVVNETLAARFFPDGRALGSKLIIDGADGQMRLMIVGIAADLRHMSLDLPPGNDIYLPLHQAPPSDVIALANSMYWLVRTDPAPLTLAAPLRRALQAVDGDVPMAAVRSMDQVVGVSVAPRRFNLLLLMVFAGAALALATIGVYGVTSQIAHQRTRELGIRIALGATRADIVRLVTADTLRAVAVGGLAGSLVAWFGGLLVRDFLFGVDAADPLTFAVVAGGVGLVAAAASAVPALRASRVDPRITLGVDG